LSSHDTGTGLGMAIVRKIVQTHGGNLAVRSRIGHGTRIRITLNGS
ncbi:MAG: ATP-binding protein, partial [Verrucomicrobiia bacterium]